METDNYDWREEPEDALLTEIDDITCDIEDLKLNPENASLVATKNKELLFRLLNQPITKANFKEVKNETDKTG